MKTLTRNHFFNTINTPLQCERKSSVSQSVSRWLLALYGSCRDRVNQEVRFGLVALSELVADSRKLIGVLFIGAGFLSLVIHPIFNAQAIVDPQWYFLNYHFFFYSIREELLIGFWSIGTYLLLPERYTLSLVACTPALGWAIATILNYSFGLTFQLNGLSSKAMWELANKEFHSIGFSLWVIGVGFAVSVLVSVDYLVYRFNHYRRGLLQRFVGIVRMPNTSDDIKWKALEKNCEEFDKLESRI
jgi:hypothetical protein